MSEDAFTPATEIDSPREQSPSFSVGAWILDYDGRWHATIRFDGNEGTHHTACGETLDAPDEIFEVALEGLEAISPDQEEQCQDCEGAIDAAEEVTGYV